MDISLQFQFQQYRLSGIWEVCLKHFLEFVAIETIHQTKWPNMLTKNTYIPVLLTDFKQIYNSGVVSIIQTFYWIGTLIWNCRKYEAPAIFIWMAKLVKANM